MAKKSFNYFYNFIKLSGKGKDVADRFNNVLNDYENIAQHAGEISSIESEADKMVDEIMHEVNASFITPIDREDIIGITEALDNVVDAVEDAANQFDIYSIKKIRPEAKEISALLCEAANALFDVVVLFENFKNYDALNEQIRIVRKLEEKGDKLVHQTVKSLFLETNADAIEIVKWNAIYETMERALNDCERAAKLVGSIAIKNT